MQDQDRFSRIKALIGSDSWQRLPQARVTVIGVGAVGSYATEALARSGVGSLRLVDFDTVHPSNINRQLLALESTIGQPKVDIAAARVADINPDCRVEAINKFADSSTLPEILDNEPHLIIDAIDSVGPKCRLLAEIYHTGIPILSSMGAALRTDANRIKTGDLMDSSGCPLAKLVRGRLRKEGVGRGIFAVWSDEQVQYDFQAAPVDEGNSALASGRARIVLGSLPTITAIFGLRLAHEALQMLTEVPE